MFLFFNMNLQIRERVERDGWTDNHAAKRRHFCSPRHFFFSFFSFPPTS